MLWYPRTVFLTAVLWTAVLEAEGLLPSGSGDLLHSYAKWVP